MAEQVKDLETSGGEKEETLRLRKATLDLLPDAANNIARLEVRCDALEQLNVSLPYPLLDNIRVMVIVCRLRGNIIRTAPC